MSSHFTYEIDENNIRAQLKRHTVAPTEEDWITFNSGQSQHETSNNRKKINYVVNVTLNRNVLIPAAFGLMIVIFATLLFNVINIKRTTKTETISASAQPEVNVKVEPSLAKKPLPQKPIEVQVKVPQQTTIKQEENINYKSEASMLENKIVQAQGDLKPTKNQVVKSSIPADSVKPLSEINSNKPDTSNKTTILTSESAKKKSKQSTREPFNFEKASDLRPALISEDRDTEERPEETP